MIKNERQYRITRAQADRFSAALRRLDAGAADRSERHPRLLSVQREALQSQLSDLEADLREYEALKAGDFAFGQLKGVAELPRQLIRARIAPRPQSTRAGRPPRVERATEFQRYEASDYASASFGRIQEVVSALGVEVDRTLLADEGNTR